MKLDAKEILFKEEVGATQKGEKVLHILTKGGWNCIAAVSRGGAVRVLGSGVHRAHAKNNATKVEKIDWNTESNLFKSEMPRPSSGSSPKNHYDLAAFHSKMAGKIQSQLDPHSSDLSDKMRVLGHSDTALKHYQMAGMDAKSARIEHDKNSKYHKELESTQAPHDHKALEHEWKIKNPSTNIKGLLD